MNAGLLIIVLSILLQLLSVALTIRLVHLTGRRLAGGVILATILLMAFRRLISFYRFLTAGKSQIDLFAEVIALTVSALLAIGVIYITRLILSERKSRELLRESEGFLQTIIETEPECVKLLGPDGSLLMMNRAGLDMIGASSVEEVKGRCVYPLVLPEHREAFRSLTERVFQGHSGTLEFEIEGAGGRRLWLETHAVPLRKNEGEVVSLLGVTRDITEKKRLREEREKLIAELREALMNVKVLKGFFPICVSCKKIRDDGGYWNQIDSYLRQHSEVEFSHSFCPDCAKKMYPDYY